MPDPTSLPDQSMREGLATVNDRFATEFQETGIASAAMLTLAEIVASVDALGVDQREVVVLGTVFTTDEGEKTIAQAESRASDETQQKEGDDA